MDTVRGAITIKKEHWDEMRINVESCLPNETCGLVAGRERCSVEVFPIANVLQSPNRFSLDPQQQLDAMLWIEEKGLELIAIYHSHPAGPSYPSLTDINESAFPGTVYLIWHPNRRDWLCRGFSIQAGQIQEVRLDIVGEE
jgi:proteasome lid subunit RPN8/RPN11